MKGIIHSFESLGALDGEGLRFCVFLAGCPLRCAYCHNPDTWQMRGTEFTPEELFRKILRFRPYFGSRGGVTFSGGEPLLHTPFLLETAKLLKEANITYIIDTSGTVPLSDAVKEVLSGSEQILLDLKFWDEASYQKYTGSSLTGPLETLSYLETIGKRTVLRTVIVPGINDSETALSRYLTLVRGKKCIEKYELLAFHTMGFFKYGELGIENPLIGVPPLSREKLEELQNYVNKNRA